MGAERRDWLALLLALAALLAGARDARAQSRGADDPVEEVGYGQGLLLDDRPAADRHSANPAQAIDVDLQSRIKDLDLVEHDGRIYVRPAPGATLVPADAWLRALHDEQEAQRARGFLYRLFNITKPWSFAWIAVGFAGQALFTFRMVLQWYVSEKEKRSVVPVAFWWGSLFGGILLFVYFVWRKDIVGIIGQSTGIFVYARNLVLIHRRTTPES